MKKPEVTETTSGRRQAFFFLGRLNGNVERYSHSAVVLAEGLAELGWKISSDTKAWQSYPGSEYLFPGQGMEAVASSDLIVFAENYFMIQGTDRLPKLPSTKAARIYLDRSDLTVSTNWINGESFRHLDLILRCHASGYFKYADNVRPSVFGISNRISAACASPPDVARSQVIWNFNHGAFPHSVRIQAERNVMPLLASRFQIASELNEQNEQDTEYGYLMRRQTDGRHFTSYFEKLSKSLLCSCFGGWFLIPCRQKEGGPFCLWTRKLVRRLPVVTSLIAQWDSWRLWEAFAAGSAVLHVNFEEHQFLMGGPMPEPLIHYIPVDIKNPLKGLLPLLDRPEEIIRIGESGKRWALENYGPRPMAVRTLRHLGLS